MHSNFRFETMILRIILLHITNYDFEILNKLEGNGFISQSKTSKSLYLTEEGLNEGKKLDEQITMR